LGIFPAGWSDNRNSARRVSLVILATALIPTSGLPAAEPPLGHSFLTSTTWSATAFTQHAGGTVCWLPGGDGSLRVEVRRESDPDAGNVESGAGVPPDLEPLLKRTGEGWTLVLGPDGKGTLNAWGREWRTAPASLSRMVRLIIVSLRDYPGRRPDFPFAVSAGQSPRRDVIPRPKTRKSDQSRVGDADVWRFQIPPLDLESNEGRGVAGFRRKMTARGRGAGGRDEIVALRWSSHDGQEGYGLLIGSSRRPGSLRLKPPRDLVVKTPRVEAFLPMWPLSQFLETR